MLKKIENDVGCLVCRMAQLRFGTPCLASATSHCLDTYSVLHVLSGAEQTSFTPHLKTEPLKYGEQKM